MIWGLISIVFLYLGYKLNSRRLETDFEADIYSIPKSYDDAASEPLGYRQTQLMQFGLTFGIEGFFGAVIGVVYGPLTMIWSVLGSIFLGSYLNYYSGMYSRKTQKSLISVTQQVFGHHAYIGITVITCIFLTIELCVNYAFFLNIATSVFKGSLFWYVPLVAVMWLGFTRPKDFNRVCILTGLFILLITLYLCFMSVSQFSNISISVNPLHYPNLKQAYPVLFFTVNVGVLSGLQALKSSITAEHVRNERMGIDVFVVTTLLQAGVVIVWSLLILAWNPAHMALFSAISKTSLPSTVLHDNLTVYTGKISEWSVYALLAIVCILSAGTMLRLTVKFIKEANILPNFSSTTHGAIFLAIGFVLFYFSVSLIGHELISLLIAIYLLYMCIYLRKQKQQSIKELWYTIYFLSGACVAYLQISILHLPVSFGVVCGIFVTLVWGLLTYYRRK